MNQLPLGRETYLIVLPWLLREVGGVNEVVRNLYDGMLQLGRYRPRVLQLRWSAPETSVEVDREGRELCSLRIRGPFDPRKPMQGFIVYLLNLPLEIFRIRELVRSLNVKVVNCHYIGGAEFSWIAAKLLRGYRGRLILSFHGADIRAINRTRGITRFIWRWALSNADACVACSSDLAREIADFGVPSSRIVTIYNGLNAPRLRTEIADQSQEVTREIVSLGTFEHKKGHDILIRAFARLKSRIPEARLRILGRSADCLNSTRDLVMKLGLQSHIELMTDMPHLAAMQALNRAAVFALPSRQEAFSVALLEAGALGKAVVATDVCGVRELINNQEHGLIVQPEDEAALAEAIIRLLEDTSLARRLGSNLQARVSERFTIGAMSAGYAKLACNGQSDDGLR